MPIPTHWSLHGGTLHVHYNSGGGGTFHYVDGGFHQTFTGPAQIHVATVNPGPGILVSVRLLDFLLFEQKDFTVLLPNTEVDAAHPVEPITTDGITSTKSLFPLIGQKDHYVVQPLTGLAH
jgi:hypothetical protein